VTLKVKVKFDGAPVPLSVVVSSPSSADAFVPA